MRPDADGRVLLLEADDAALARFAFASVKATARCLSMRHKSVLRLI